MPKYKKQQGVPMYNRVMPSAASDNERAGIKMAKEVFSCDVCGVKINKDEKFLLQTIVGRRRKLCMKCRQKILDDV